MTGGRTNEYREKCSLFVHSLLPFRHTFASFCGWLGSSQCHGCFGARARNDEVHTPLRAGHGCVSTKHIKNSCLSDKWTWTLIFNCSIMYLILWFTIEHGFVYIIFASCQWLRQKKIGHPNRSREFEYSHVTGWEVRSVWIFDLFEVQILRVVDVTLIPND